MSNRKFASGAFVFTRARRLVPRAPEEIIPIAQKHGFAQSSIPPYAGDRAAVGRAITANTAFAAKEGFLLRPIRRSGTDVAFAIVREETDGIEKVAHEQSDLIRWSAEKADDVEGLHPIARRVAATYAELREKLVGEDWTATVTVELERLGAVPFREDGRVYWLPPQSLKAAGMLRGFLEEIGLVLVIAAVEAEVETVVRDVVAESVADQLAFLKHEVEAFDGKNKPSTYARRLEEYQRLRQKAILYRDSLGIGVEQAVTALDELEARVGSMLDIRKTTVVHRGGASSPAVSTPTVPAKPAVTGLKFSGAIFENAGFNNGVHRFTSGEAVAITAIKALETMGIAGKWQQAGSVQVLLKNSGPKGADVSIEVKGDADITTTASSLACLGISLNQ